MAVFRSIEPFQGSGFEGISEFLIFIGLPAVAFAILGSQCVYSDIVPCPLVMGDLKTRDCFFPGPVQIAGTDAHPAFCPGNFGDIAEINLLSDKFSFGNSFSKSFDLRNFSFIPHPLPLQFALC